MAMIIPFANPLGPQNGPAADGVIFGVLPQVPAATALSQIHLAPFTKVLRGNADASGSVTWSNVTTAANNDTAGDVSLFDTINPTADRLCIELSADDEIDGVSLLLSTAAVVSPAPSKFEAFVIRKSLARIQLMRQQVGETLTDWELRINMECQAAPAGGWATSFWAQLDAAVAAETPDGVKGGAGRGA